MNYGTPGYRGAMARAAMAQTAAAHETPAWLAYAGAPLEQVPGDVREEVRRHREDPENPAHMPVGAIPAWLAYAGIPLEQIPDDGQREEVRRHRAECEDGDDELET